MLVVMCITYLMAICEMDHPKHAYIAENISWHMEF